MNVIRNSIIIIHDYELRNITKIQKEANAYWSQYYSSNVGKGCYLVSPIMFSTFHDEYTFVINGDCAWEGEFSKIVYSDRIKWCDYIYRKYLPQNITIVNIGDGAESYIEYQLPKIEEYKNGSGTSK